MVDMMGSSALTSDIFMLGVGPVINASIVFSVLAVVPEVKKKIKYMQENMGREVSPLLAPFPHPHSVVDQYFLAKCAALPHQVFRSVLSSYLFMS